MSTLLSDITAGLPPVEARARAHARRHRLDRARHGRDDGRLHARGSGAAAHAARRRSAGARPGDEPRIQVRQQLGRRQRAVLPHVPRSARSQSGLRGHVRALRIRASRSAHAGRTERVAGELVTGTYFTVLRRRRRPSAACSRPTMTASGRASGRRAEPRILDVALRRGPRASSGNRSSSTGIRTPIVGVARAGFDGVELGTRRRRCSCR